MIRGILPKNRLRMTKRTREDWAKIKERGAEGEKLFTRWLDRSGRPYFEIEQSKFTMPRHLSGHCKRPDYYVGFPNIGTLGCEIKAKSMFNGAFIFDEEEFMNMDNFSQYFAINIVLFFFSPEEPELCYFIRNADLLAMEPVKKKGGMCVEIRPEAMFCVRYKEVTFQDAVLDALLRLQN